jgi:hypothetical protein
MDHEKIHFRLITLCSMHCALCYSLGIGWLTWDQVKKLLEISRLDYKTPTEREPGVGSGLDCWHFKNDPDSPGETFRVIL